jgi:DNA-binding transcriptional regulator YiaG
VADALDTPVCVVRHNRVPGIHQPGVATAACAERGCTTHTFDWRERPGSPANTHGITAALTRTTLREALSASYATEAHLTAYLVLGADGAPLAAQPRVTKDSLPWLRAEGYRVVVTCFLADADTPGHVPWTPELLAAFDALWASAAGPLATAGLYLSPKGYRLVQPLTQWVDVEEGERSLRTWLRELIAVGVDPRVEDVHDWTRLMRTPHHRRPTGAVRAPRVDLSRMVAVAPPPPATDVSPVTRRRATQPRATAGGAELGVAFVDEVPGGWEHAADAIGAAIRDTVTAQWRRCYLALAAALASRSCPLEGIPAVVVRAHRVDPAWAALTADRLQIARTTVVRWANGQELLGYACLRAEFPGVADALDAVTTDGAEARVLRQLAAAAPAPMPVADAVAVIQRTLREAVGVTLIAAPPGTGKTHAVAQYARTLPPVGERAAPGSRVAVSAPRHDLARQTAAKLPRSLHVFSPPSLLDEETGRPVCAYADAARGLAAGRQSVRREFCDGRGQNPCELADGCRARAGVEGDPHANLVVGVHGLVRELRAYAGAQGVLVVDEPGEVTVVERVTLDDLDTARRYLDAFSPRYAAQIAPALAALTAWVRERGAVTEGTTLHSLHDAVVEAVDLVPEEVLAEAALPEAATLGWQVVLAARGAIADEARSHAPPLTWRSVALARATPGRAAELGRASRVLDLVWRALGGAVPFAVRLDDRSGDRAASVVTLNTDFTLALAHEGPVVVLDANAGLHRAAIAKVFGAEPAFVDLAVADGAPIARTVLATASATRKAWMPRGVPDWQAILPALRAALAWAAEDPSASRLALIAPKEIHVALAHCLAPTAPETLALVQHSRLSRRALDEVRRTVGPTLATWRGEIVLGHYGALEGLDHMAGCDATVTLMDPRPNLGDEHLRAEYLGLDVDGRLDALAAAELQQAHGRLRTIHRTRPGRQLHVGAVVPAGWPGLAVEVRRLPVGRPRTAAAMTGTELAQAREALGMGLRELARALGVSASTLTRYELGERAVPMAIATAVLALTPSVPETPCKSTPYQGFRERQVFSTPAPVATGGFGNTPATAPLQGVSGTPDPDDGGAGGGKPRRARRLDLRVILGESPAHAPAPLARSEDGRGKRC